MTIEATLERIATALESLVALGTGSGATPAATPAAAKEEKKAAKPKPAKITAEEKKNASEAEVTGKAEKVNEPDLLEEKVVETTEDQVRAALQAYAATFAADGNKEARALMVKAADLKDADTKLKDLPKDKFAAVVAFANKATVQRKADSL